MNNYDDHRISFPVPNGWHIKTDESGNILYNDPSDEETWCFVQLGGLRQSTPNKPVPTALDFLTQIYEQELTAGVAAIFSLSDRAFVEWEEKTINDGRDFIVYHFHLASNAESGDIQMADFSLAAPILPLDTMNVSRKRKLFSDQMKLARFHIWRKG